MASTIPLDPKIGRRVERILALGYTEAVRRRTAGCHPQAIVDGLVEATVMACDLHHMFVHKGSPCPSNFYLSHVRLDIHGSSLSSLAPFDSDIAELFSLTEPIEIYENIRLFLPSGIGGLGHSLEGFWKVAVREFNLYQPLIPDSRSDPRIVADEIAEEFFASMRHAFDSIAQFDNKNTFTLRAEWTKEPHEVCKGEAVHYVLGYWLPATGLYSLPPHVPRDRFETLLRTTRSTPRVRQQSHTNVTTRLAALICQPGERSQRFSELGEYSFINDLELKVWPHGDYAQIFMVPFSSHDLSPQFPRTMAHAFKGFDESVQPDIEQLLLWRYRASLLFSENLRRGYCQAVGHHLAAFLLASGNTIEDLNADLRELAEAYSMPLVVAAVERSRGKSLESKLQKVAISAIDSRAAERSRQWLRAISETAQHLSINWNTNSLADEIAMQVWVARELDAQIRDTTLFQKIADQTDRIDNLVKGIQDATASIDDLLNEDPNAAEMHKRLIAMQQVGLFGRGLPHSGAQTVRLDNRVLRVAHNQCQRKCSECDSEDLKRVACLFDIPEAQLFRNPNGTVDVNPEAPLIVRAAQKYISHCSKVPVDQNTTGTWVWVKRAAQGASDNQVNLACIVTLLFKWMETVNIDVSRECDYTVPLRLSSKKWGSRWRSMLLNMARLATPRGKEIGVSISVKPEAQDLLFELRGMDFSWFDRSVNRARTAIPIRVSQASGDRLHQIAGAFGAVTLPIESVEDVEVRVIDGGAALLWVWKNVLETEPSI